MATEAQAALVVQKSWRASKVRKEGKQPKVPKQQKALIFEEIGVPKLVSDSPTPTLTDPSAVLIKVIAAGVNPVDWKLLFSNFMKLKLPAVLGCDFSGTIVQIGTEVKEFKVGDEVFAYASLASPGSFAEYVVVPEHRLVRKGSKVTHIQAASLPVAFLSAWDGFNQIKVEAKQTVYIPGGAGGVGHFAIQIAKHHGAVVISSGGKEDSLAVLKRLGVDHILNYSKDDVVGDVLKLTEGKGVDYVFDATYVSSSFATSAKTLKEGGTLVILGSTDPPPETAKFVSERKGKLAKADLSRYTSREDAVKLGKGLTEANSLIEQGKLVPITKTLALGELAGALLEMQKGKTQPGKLVVEIGA